MHHASFRSSGVTSGRLAVSRSPEDSPRSRRWTQGARYSRAQRALPAKASRRGTGAAAGRGVRQSDSSVSVAERPQGREGDPPVALGGHVDAVVGPHPPVAEGDQAPLVEDAGAVPLGDAPDQGGEGSGPAAGGPHERGADRVERRGHEDVGAGVADADDSVLELAGEGVDVGARPQDVVAAADDADEVRLQGQGGVELRPDDVGQEPPADGEVGVAELVAGVRRIPGEVDGEPVGPPDVPVGDLGVRVGHALGERVADGDVAGPDAGFGLCGGHANLQSTGRPPASTSSAFARLNGRDPKNPACAESGEGWADSTRGTRPSMGPSDWAWRPQRIATSGPPRATRASIAAAVTRLPPLALVAARTGRGSR